MSSVALRQDAVDILLTHQPLGANRRLQGEPRTGAFRMIRGQPLFAACLIQNLCLTLLVMSQCGCGNPGAVPLAQTDTSAQQSDAEVDPSDGIATPVAPGIVRWVSVPELPEELAIIESVFWEPDDTLSLRKTISTEPALKNSDVLEIGTGSGLVSLCCLQAGAARVVATDINPAAVENARQNAKELGFGERFDVRLVPRRAPEAWTVIEAEATFDLIISNPPWENDRPGTVKEFALYDPDFALLKSLVTGARKRLRENGRMWLAYGCVTAIRKIQEVAAAENLSCTILDERKLDELPEVFLPGMLIEITVPE